MKLRSISRRQRQRLLSSVLSLALLVPAAVSPVSAADPTVDSGSSSSTVVQKRQAEYLGRGVVAVQTEGGIFVSWRLLGTDKSGTAFHLYRDGVKLNGEPITAATNFLDPDGTAASKYTVRAVVSGVEQEPPKPAGVWGKNYLSVPLKKPADGVNPDGTPFTYSANDASAGDLDGDGEYELIVKWDPSNSKDNSQNGITGEVFIDAYKQDGTLLWRISLGRNIRAGAHYTQFLVYDFDGDGRAEAAFKTADGTVDGTGQVIGDASADYGDAAGRILSGPEFLSIFDGKTGKVLDTVPYDPPRGNVSDWGDSYGNRVDRFLAAVAYLDGEHPSLVMARGYYTRAVLAAYNFRDGKLSKVWTFDSNNPGSEGYRGQGNHNLSVADVDGDGRDEITYGAAAINDNGQGLYTTGLGHGDAMHLGDLDPTRPGLEVFQVHEDKNAAAGIEYRDARTGQMIWGVYTGKDTGRGMSADIDPAHPGEEVWASGKLFSSQGTQIGAVTPSSTNFGIWWDGDPLRELLDQNRIDKWDYTAGATRNLFTSPEIASNNGTKATPNLQADLLGDWREEAVWRSTDSSELRIYTTTAVTDRRLPTLMHDPVYRLGVAWQNVGYNQPPHTGFFLGDGMTTPPAPSLYAVHHASVDLQPNPINLKSSTTATSATAYLELPDNGAKSIDPASVTLSVYGRTLKPLASPVLVGDYDADGKKDLMLKFDRNQLIQALQGAPSSVQAVFRGRLKNGDVLAGETVLTITR
ncbi:rhamnogalacturonan lyase [Paenibacillus caseinilyticus]|uniref:Rhamnogalacturonan lyase yesW n=1 Tax=Paenibacillus mucilaginosus K02 TaxID=997761 RepID=I0BNW0_9BACL|nr:rhamnogalacturonate lyase [Paenibacillus mucilaginosus K02]AFK65396.1 rhamnogalacturonan lyase yesW [Paenibacillus mucilaginosus K02]